ncbi:hypothetical protein [Mesorhizobium sp. 1M-11]|uniref:hypothetical protein n=1 Tax=Mesorhizobium sp. 1M-11 TaxID=1529006 RepID=UPI00128FB3EB|nr:hypothetical protein [Mesorhizobium sp. 1M-11]
MKKEWFEGSFTFLPFLFCFCLMLFSATLVVPAHAAQQAQASGPSQPMRFAVVRSGAYSCEPNCPEWIWAEGDIGPGTAVLFKRFLKKLGGRKLPIVLQSRGGDLNAALAMGRMIRQRGLDVAVGYTTFTTCAPRQSGCDAEKKGGYKGVAAAGFAYCYSACPLILAGGTRRLVGAWAQLGVHQVTTTYRQQLITYRITTRIVKGKKIVTKKVVGRKSKGTFSTTDMSKKLRRDLVAYLAEMGISAQIVEPINNTPASDILVLTQDEMLKLRLITSVDQVDALTSPAICKTASPSVNCRQLPVAPAVAAASPTTVQSPPRGISPGVTGQAMRFAIVRSSESGCEPVCPEWISAEGVIRAETPGLLEKTLNSVKDKRLLVVLTSSGGDAEAAMAIGRIIRNHGLSVALGKTKFSGCEPSQGDCSGDGEGFSGRAGSYEGYCAAECALVVIGGAQRFAASGAIVTLRRKGTEASKDLEQRLAQYLAEMGVDNKLLVAMQAPPGAGFDPPTPAEMEALKLITNTADVEYLTAAALCKDPPASEGCTARPLQSGND